MDKTLLADAICAADIAVLVLDEFDCVMDCTPPATKLLNKTPERLLGVPISSLVHLPPTQRTPSEPLPMPRQGVTHSSTAQNIFDQGVPLDVNIVRWKDAAGRSRATVTLRNDAAAREVARVTRNNLIQSDNAIRGANIAVFEYDLATHSVSVSNIWREMLELGPTESFDEQEEWRSRVHPDDLTAALEPVRLCGEGLTERASCEYRLHSRDRSQWRWMRTDIAVAQRDLDGRPSLLVGAQTDISERKSMEEALRVSVEQFRSTFENAPIGNALVALDGTFLKVNPALSNLLGYSEEELIQSDFQALTHPDDIGPSLNEHKMLMTGFIPSINIEKRYIRSDSTILWCKLIVALVRDADGRPNHTVAQIVDITEQRRLDRLKSEFVSVVSHELRTPLTAILGALSLLDPSENTSLSDDVQRLLFIAKANGERLHRLINDILDFQKFSTQQTELTLSAQPIAPLIEESRLLNHASTDRRGIQIETEFLDPALYGLVNQHRFHQIMANLLSNAVKFSNPGSTIELSAKPQGSWIRISVTNTGREIPEAFRDQIFTPFSQVPLVSGQRPTGTGLGLSITQKIVKHMGGDIGFESTPAGKTTFWFTVRAKKTPAQVSDPTA